MAKILESDEVQEIDEALNTIEDLIRYYCSIGGFTAKYVCESVRILEDMILDDDVTILMSFTANIVATGLRGLLAKFIRSGFVDVVITTAGALDHDIAKSCGAKYLKHDFDTDDVKLREMGYCRIGSIIVHREHYGAYVEKIVHKTLSQIYNVKRRICVRELIWEIGKNISDDRSIVRAASTERTPIYVPGFVDGAFGTAILTFNEMMRAQGREQIVVDVLEDEREIMNVVYSSKRLGGIIVGGGISKHHLIWWSQLRDGLDYAIYITTATEWDGSLSGARPREAVSWSKIKTTAKTTVVYADATIVLPILISYVLSKFKRRRRKTFL